MINFTFNTANFISLHVHYQFEFSSLPCSQSFCFIVLHWFLLFVTLFFHFFLNTFLFYVYEKWISTCHQDILIDSWNKNDKTLWNLLQEWLVLLRILFQQLSLIHSFIYSRCMQISYLTYITVVSKEISSRVVLIDLMKGKLNVLHLNMNIHFATSPSWNYA